MSSHTSWPLKACTVHEVRRCAVIYVLQGCFAAHTAHAAPRGRLLLRVDPQLKECRARRNPAHMMESHQPPDCGSGAAAFFVVVEAVRGCYDGCSGRDCFQSDCTYSGVPYRFCCVCVGLSNLTQRIHRGSSCGCDGASSLSTGAQLWPVGPRLAPAVFGAGVFASRSNNALECRAALLHVAPVAGLCPCIAFAGSAAQAAKH